MGRFRTFYASTLGKKAVAAVTGAILFLFLLGHMTGNLKTFMGLTDDGIAKLDVYAEFLRTMGEPLFSYGQLLWIARIVLLAALILHVTAVVQLVAHNRRARPVAYVKHKRIESSWAAHWMMGSGLLLLAFIVFHILHFTTGTVEFARFVHGEVYANVYYAFQHWYVSLIYVVAMVILCYHLYHGVWSLFQTLGIDNPDRNRGLRAFAAVAAIGLLIGFCSVPVLVHFGVVPPPTFPSITAGVTP